MVLRAVGLSAIQYGWCSVSSTEVLPEGHWFEVPRVYAPGMFAEMVEVSAIRDWTY